MTMPYERTRNVLQAGAFLKELRADQSLPEHIRNEANRLLRHYPTTSDIRLLAQTEAGFMGSKLLTSEFDVDWFKEYRFGAHAYGHD